jgi:hypothetical protein
LADLQLNVVYDLAATVRFVEFHCLELQHASSRVTLPLATLFLDSVLRQRARSVF